MGRASSPRLRLLLGLHVAGVADDDALVRGTRLGVDVVADEVDRAVDSDLVVHRAGRHPGYVLTPEGRFQLRRLLDEELARPGVGAAVRAAYQDFLYLNGDLLGVCTAWQLRPDADGATAANDHSDPAYDGSVIDRLVQVHEPMGAVLDALTGALSRFARYRPALQNALDRLRAGDHDYFTRPLFPSYHSIWFELHEDLLVTLDTSRRHERSVPS